MNRTAHPEWKFDSTLQYGLIAQEVEKIFPEIVSTISADGYKGIDYVKLVPVLLEGIKEQQGIIEKQQIGMAALKEEMAELKELVEQMVPKK